MLILFPGHYGAHKAEEESKAAPSPAETMRKEIAQQTKSYYGNVPKVVKGADIKGHEKKFDWAVVQQKPKDWEFMLQSGEVLRNLPETWTAYPDTEGGRKAIVEMEFKEFMDAGTPEAREHELVHLASACLHLWRYYEHID